MQRGSACLAIVFLLLFAPSAVRASGSDDDDDHRGDEAPRCAEPGARPRLISSGERPYGRSFDQWSQAWWQWVYSVPAPENPVIDLTGAQCGVAQHGPAWFLAGTFGGVATTRTCAVPCDRALFLPLTNCEWENAWVGEPVLSIAELRARCTDPAAALTLEIDGRPVRLGKTRVVSSLFSYHLPADNIVGQPPGNYYPVVGDGEYVMIAPLAPGPHTVHFTARTAAGATQDTTYRLTIQPLDSLCGSPPCP